MVIVFVDSQWRVYLYETYSTFDIVATIFCIARPIGRARSEDNCILF